MLEAFARVLNHPVLSYLENAFVKTVDSNRPATAISHYHGIKEGIHDLLGVAIFDHLPSIQKSIDDLKMMMWKKREIENYLPIPQVIFRFIEKEYQKDLFTQDYPQVMKSIVDDYIPGIAQKDPTNEWWNSTKMSDEFLDRVFRDFYKKIDSVILMDKSRYYKLAELSVPEELDVEIKEALDEVYQVALQAEEIISKENREI
jgi:hypothetical protein